MTKQLSKHCKKLLLTCFFASVQMLLFAQTIITGKVSDGNEGLPGVSVKLKGTSIGIITNKDGNYSISVPDTKGTLVFTFLGYTTKELAINGRTVINTSLESSLLELNQVVVTGYTSQRSQDIVGSVSVVKPKDFENQPVASVDALLQGRASGVQVISNNGAPGAGVTVKIRGTNSINAGNDPLYIIDGVPVVAGDFSDRNVNPGAQNSGSFSSSSALSDINQNDIESISILKDASATSIYGARAANGVVLITTKQGKAGKSAVSFNVNSGFTQAPTLNVLRTPEVIELLMDQNINANMATPTFLLEPGIANRETNWQKELFRTGSYNSYDFAVRGGVDKVTYSLSTGYLNQQGIVKTSQYQRFTTRLNLNFNINSKLKIQTSSAYTRSAKDEITGDNNERAVINQALRKLPFTPVYDTTGNGAYNFTQYIAGTSANNPIAQLNEVDNPTKGNRFLQSLTVNFTPIKNLTIRSILSGDILDNTATLFQTGQALLDGSRKSVNSQTKNLQWTNTNTINYAKTFNKIHSLNILAGDEITASRFDLTRISSTGQTQDVVRLVSAGSVYFDPFTDTKKASLVSFFGRIAYNFNQRYYLELNARNDASSRFGRDNRNAFFPAVAAKWRISEEAFIKKIQSISELNLRTSIGRTGNQIGIDEYAAFGSYTTGRNYSGFAGIVPQAVGSPDLKWETTDKYMVGLDLGLLNNRVYLTAEAYIHQTRDLLNRVTAPQETGLAVNTITQNFGDVQNSGFDFDISTRNLQRKLKWDTKFNIGFTKNLILRVPASTRTTRYNAGPNIGTAGADYAITYIFREGQPIGVYNAPRALGVYATDAANTKGLRRGNGEPIRAGDRYFEDANLDNAINFADDNGFIVGRGIPLFSAGLTNIFSYKQFTLNTFLQSTYGNDVLNYPRAVLEEMNDNSNANRNTLNRWRGQGQVTDMPKAVQGSAVNNGASNYFEDGSFLRLKFVTVGYALPASVLSRLKIQSAKVFVTGNNLITWTKYSGLDPEVNAASSNPGSIGIDYGTFPQSRAVTFGFNIGL